MRVLICFTACLFFLQPFLYSQPSLLNKTAANAFVITRMAVKFHVQPRELNDHFSNDFFSLLLNNLDEDHNLFMASDIHLLQQYQFTLDDEIKQKKTSFLQLFIQITQKRLQQADSLITEICKKPVDFTIDEKIDLQDSSYPADISAMRLKFSKTIKYEMLDALSDYNDTLSLLTEAKQKKFIDSIEVKLRKKMQVIHSRAIKSVLQGAGGAASELCNEYCKAIANCYDPHTEYFPLTEKENFESELGNQPFRFGFKIEESDDNGILITHLQPASPAFKSGLLNEGDKIEKLQWQGSESIDVSDANAGELIPILDQNNHATLILTVKKADGSIRQVPLVKEQVENSDEEDKVRSFVLKGNKTIGYISLPAFYSDWNDEEEGINGCANDVAKGIINLLKQNISGLIIDLRYNGGGSLQEAMELTGIFIDAGPVEQIKHSEAKIFTLKDANRGTIYNGPLILLVNGYSASASEMLAGTLQDYNRALIVGSPTYGKATGQLVLPMDTTVNLNSETPFRQTESYIKITTSTLYRITGTTAQGSGVIPDIQLPDILEMHPEREKDEHFWLHSANIESNKYYKPMPPLPLADLKQKAAACADTMKYFIYLKKYIALYDQLQQQKEISLKWSTDLIKNYKKEKEISAYFSSVNAINNNLFTVDDNLFMKERLLVNSSLKDTYQASKTYLSKDAYIKICYLLLSSMAQ